VLYPWLSKLTPSNDEECFVRFKQAGDGFERLRCAVDRSPAWLAAGINTVARRLVQPSVVTSNPAPICAAIFTSMTLPPFGS
jgi:hypothetical protein